uniref:Rho GTPase activating protein 31 n=1 Tax=Jaculus jaculus TaxID=51337 RepID=A0A8C5JZZ2_JACJA
PYVLKSCAEFIETHGIVDGIYRLSGVTSNIQRLRQEFGSDQCPDLTREVYLQDIHCVGSLCKLYFRELPNPLLTYELYEKFTEAVSHCPEEGQLARIQNVIQELPPSHYRTLEYLIRHLAHIASFSSKTNMHARNLALVWAPNLLRYVPHTLNSVRRVQQVVIEFILKTKGQDGGAAVGESVCFHARCFLFTDNRPITKSLTLPALSLPMKLVSLEEAQARSLATNHPARKERRENSLPEIVPPMGTLFHTVLELPDNKRKLSSKSKKWKSIFNLGRSGSDSKSKLSRNGSVFVRGQRLSVEKATIRPAKSMDSLCSVPVEGKENKGNFNRTVNTGGFFIPATKMHAPGTGSSCDLSKQEGGDWGAEGTPAGAEGGQGRPPPEQLKVFRAVVVEDPESSSGEQPAPKMLGMFYTSSEGPPGKSGFGGGGGHLFPVEASPRHPRKALNISEPFAVWVPLRVSAVISANSTPCRTPPKEPQSLSSLDELALQGSERGGWPEEKPPGAEPSAASVAKKAVLEATTPEPGATGTAECSRGLSLELATQVEKTPLEISLSSQLSGELEERPNAEKLVEESLGAGRPEPTTPQESCRTQAEDMLLHEMDEEDLANALMWPEIQQELKIIESEEELPSLPPLAQKISPTQPALESSPAAHFPSPEVPGSLPCSSPTLEPCTRDPTSQSTGELTMADPGPKLGLTSSLAGAEAGLGLSPPETTVALEKMSPGARIEVGGPGEDVSPPLPPDSPPPAPLDREDPSRHSRTNPCTEQPKGSDSPGIPSPCRRDESTTGQKEKQLSKITAPDEDLCPGSPSLTKHTDVSPQGEGDAAHSMQEPSDCDEDDSGTDITQHGLETEEPWEEPQWVTSPLHSPTLKEVSHQVQGSQGHRLERRLCHRRGLLRQSHSLDSKTPEESQWTLEVPASSSCADLGTERNPTTAQQALAASIEMSGWDEKALKAFRELFGLKGAGALPSHKGAARTPAKPAETSSVEEGKQKHLGFSNPPMKEGGAPGPDGREAGSPRAQESTSPEEHSPKIHPRSAEGGPSKGKNRPASLNLDSATVVADLLRLENGTSLRSSGLGEDPKVTWMTSSNCKADSWQCAKDTQDLDMVAHALTGRRNSAPVSVSAVRTSFMVKMCQAKAVPVIPPKIQYTQIPQPLPSQSPGDSGVHPLEESQEEPTSTNGTTQKPTRDDHPCPLESPKEQPKQDPGAFAAPQPDSAVPCTGEGLGLFPEQGSSSPLATQDATVQCRKRTSETEPLGDNLLSSKLERPCEGSKPFHRSRPGRPQSLILFSPPFPITDHLPPSSAVTESKVLLSPIRSPSQIVSPGLLCGELAENTWVTPEGVTRRNKMTIPKNGQRLETSTSCFYQPQRRSVLLDGRSGRQIE